MSARLLPMSEDPLARSQGVLLPPPSHPDDGPSALEVPPLDLPPTSLQRELNAGRGRHGFPLRTWAVFFGLFALGTAITFLLQR